MASPSPIDPVPAWTPSELRERAPSDAVVWTYESLVERAGSGLGRPTIAWPSEPSPGIAMVVVVGGGKLIDHAKVWRHDHSPDTTLVAVPTIWGSGAEASEIAVLDRDGGKQVHMGPAYRPNARVVRTELASGLAPWRIRAACGDAWAHALEGFASPLATEPLREALGQVLRGMLALPLDVDARWFELSALACAGQARSSVGLAHGIAHTLEGPLAAATPTAKLGHARLCANLIGHVLDFDRERSEALDRYAEAHGVPLDAIASRLRELVEPELQPPLFAALEAHWKQVLRDPCTRTNVALVRRDALEFFRPRMTQGAP